MNCETSGDPELDSQGENAESIALALAEAWENGPLCFFGGHFFEVDIRGVGK